MNRVNVRRAVLINVILGIVVVALAYFGYSYYYGSTHYVTTDNATIDAKVVPIQPEYAGQLASWKYGNGTAVKSGEVLGRVSTGAELAQLGVAAKVKSVMDSVKNAALLTSPISGTLANVNAVVGETTAPSQPLAEVVETGNPYVLANVNESDIRNVQVGQTVDVYVDSYPNLSLQGTVDSIGLAANSFFALIPPNDVASGTYTKVTQTIPVVIRLSGTAGDNLIPGTNVTVRIHRTNP